MHLCSLVYHDVLERVVVLQSLLQARQNRLVAHHESHSVRGHFLKYQTFFKPNVYNTEILLRWPLCRGSSASLSCARVHLQC